MIPHEHAVSAPHLEGAHPGLPAARLLRGAVSWALFLGAAAGIAYLFHSRVTPAGAIAPAPPLQVRAPGAEPPAPRRSSAAEVAQWRARLDAITKADAAPVELCRQLRALWPSLPEDGQMDALRRMVNLLPDSDYGTMREFAATAKLPAASWDTLATDALTRPDPVRLPVLLEILAHGSEPARGEARAELAAQLGADYGEDWARWREAIAGRISKPD